MARWRGGEAQSLEEGGAYQQRFDDFQLLAAQPARHLSLTMRAPTGHVRGFFGVDDVLREAREYMLARTVRDGRSEDTRRCGRQQHLRRWGEGVGGGWEGVSHTRDDVNGLNDVVSGRNEPDERDLHCEQTRQRG